MVGGCASFRATVLFLGNSEFSRTDDMAKIIDGLLDEVTLPQFQRQSSAIQTRQNGIQVMNVIHPGSGKDNFITQVRQTYLPDESCQRHIVFSLKHCRGIH